MNAKQLEVDHEDASLSVRDPKLLSETAKFAENEVSPLCGLSL